MNIIYRKNNKSMKKYKIGDVNMKLITKELEKKFKQFPYGSQENLGRRC